MNVFSIRNRRFMTVDNPPDDGGGSDEPENVDDVEVADTGEGEGAKDSVALIDAILDAIAALDEKVTGLSDRMDAFVDAGATVRENDDDELDAEDEAEEDLETAIEDMDFSLDDENDD